VDVQLLHLEADVVDGRVNLGAPRIHRRCRPLENGDARVLGGGEVRDLAIQIGLEVGEALVPLRVILRETLGELIGDTLGHLVEEELVFGIHGALASLQPGEMIVRRMGIQCDLFATDRVSMDWNYEISAQFTDWNRADRALPNPLRNRSMD
jgi:hypothetical protein